MSRNILLWGLILALLSVALGAFGAHGLKAIVSPEKVTLFETGVRYQFMHALALILLALYVKLYFPTLDPLPVLKWTARLFLLGILFFSGSLYLLSLQALCSYNYTYIIGPITPLGGLCFMLGWISWVRVVWSNKVDK
jgi:uncharacterized membrane protein YgdD (TMEM256/DUF423 family)